MNRSINLKKKKNLHFQLDEVLLKILTFQKSLEAVMQVLVEAERADFGVD